MTQTMSAKEHPGALFEFCFCFFFLSKLWGRQKSELIHPASQMWKVRPGEMNDSPERAEELEIKSCYSFYFGAAVTK